MSCMSPTGLPASPVHNQLIPWPNSAHTLFIIITAPMGWGWADLIDAVAPLAYDFIGVFSFAYVGRCWFVFLLFDAAIPEIRHFLQVSTN
ncbi:hypothetical protein J3F84DRAFT_366000 [Trichoderma pleuroticola]